jgi:hypothetical protein
MVVAQKLYSEFLRRGGRSSKKTSTSKRSQGRGSRAEGSGFGGSSLGVPEEDGDPDDPVANHGAWGDLAESLRTHCEGLATKQRHFIARAAAILEG